jgi:3-isopropylmalate/(R)-2-methylmalate dehydratase large subunit
LRGQKCSECIIDAGCDDDRFAGKAVTQVFGIGHVFTFHEDLWRARIGYHIEFGGNNRSDQQMRDQRTLFDKVWAAHEILRNEDGESLLRVDRHFVHEGSFHAFSKLAERGAAVAEPGLTFAVADHYVPTRSPRHDIADPDIARMVRQIGDNAVRHGIAWFGPDDPRQGIAHVVGPEQGLTLPGLLIVCGDSHTSTHGALGACGFGIGASEVAHVLATQTIWQQKPRCMRVTVDGEPVAGVTAKDIILAVIARIGVDGAAGHALEFAGSAIRGLSIEGRLTLCNMSIEAGARCGMVAPDEKTFDYVKGRPYAPQGIEFDRAVDAWSALPTDDDAQFDREAGLDAAAIAPVVTWGTSPEDALPIDACAPDPAHARDGARARHVRETLDYMGIAPGVRLTDIAIDRVFIGSCTNSRIEDLRQAAAVLAGRTSKVPGLVSPGSSAVKRQAEEEGLDRIFRDAGLAWGESGCSMCVGINGDVVAPGERCASTTNRNFRGRQGPGARTHLMSPAMAAAAAVAGHLADVRPLLSGRKI